MMARRYDGTVARIAGNLLSGQKDLWDRADSEWSGKFEDAARRAVKLARIIVKETVRTEPAEEPFHDTRDKGE